MIWYNFSFLSLSLSLYNIWRMLKAAENYKKFLSYEKFNKIRRAFLVSNTSAENAAATKGNLFRNVSFLVEIVLRISRSSRKSLLCKAGTVNSRNTCVDMRLACVACRSLVQNPGFFVASPWLSRNLSDSSPPLSYYVHASTPEMSALSVFTVARLLYNALSFSPTMQNLSFYRFPYALISLAYMFAIAQNSRLSDFFLHIYLRYKKVFIFALCLSNILLNEWTIKMLPN